MRVILVTCFSFIHSYGQQTFTEPPATRLALDTATQAQDGEDNLEGPSGQFCPQATQCF